MHPVTRDPGSKPLEDLCETRILLLALSRDNFTVSRIIMYRTGGFLLRRLEDLASSTFCFDEFILILATA